MSCKFLSTKTIWILIALLLLMSILTLYTLFANSIFGMNIVINDIDSILPITVDTVIESRKKKNPWTSKMIKAFLKSKNTKSENTKSNKNSGKYEEYMPSIITSKGSMNKMSKKTEPNNYTENSYTKHKPFTFLVGMDRIKQEYNRTISNLEAIDENNSTDRPENDACDHKGRVFVLGIMKTGTTSMVGALNQLGYYCTHDSCIHLGNWFHFVDTVHLWQPLEVIVLSLLNMTDLLHEVYLKETSNALAFGDSPWCFLYPVWDKLYPNSKYILMTRNNDETYINSYLRYLKKFGKKFVNKGLSNSQFALIALRRYHLHNQMVREYFKDRPDDLLQVQVGAPKNNTSEWDEIVDFLGCPKPKRKFPHENKSNRYGKVRKYIPIKINPNDDKWNWSKKFGDNIPYVIRDDLDEYHTLHVLPPEEFVFDWNLFVVDELRVSDPLSSVNV